MIQGLDPAQQLHGSLSREPLVPLTPRSHLLELQSSLHRGSVLHLLGQSSVSGTGQLLLLLHGGPNVDWHRLFVLQHVSEASRSNKMGDSVQLYYTIMAFHVLKTGSPDPRNLM